MLWPWNGDHNIGELILLRSRLRLKFEPDHLNINEGVPIYSRIQDIASYRRPNQLSVRIVDCCFCDCLLLFLCLLIVVSVFVDCCFCVC